VDTDAIIPKQFLKSIKRSGFGPYLFDEWRYEDFGEPGMDCTNRPLRKDFVLNQKRFKGSQVLLARDNFGCGSSREHAPIAIKAAGISCVIAPSFARIFYRNAFNMGLPIFESAEAVAGAKEGDELDVDAATGVIKNLTQGTQYQAAPIPEFMQALIADGGLMAHIAKKGAS
jgi:3-isopropylmalate/(R)-2-methylmalate dehydratase small subunit